MNAIEFVKKFGIKEAKDQLENPKLVYGAQVDYHFMNDLKQIVEAWQLVEKAGGVEDSKLILASIKPWYTGYNIVSKTYFGGDIFSYEQEFYIRDLLESINLVEKCNES